MSLSVSHLRIRIILSIIMIIFIWQVVRLFPWSVHTQNTEVSIKTSSLTTPVLVSIYYEALCPDSKSFIIKQVLPAYEKAPKLMILSLIPYGKAKTVEDGSGNLAFSCQHGPTECQANKIHACAIEHVPDQKLLIKYIACMISNNMIPEHIAVICGQELSIDSDPIVQCSRTRHGSELLKHYGELTDALSPHVTFIPTVLLNNERKKQSAVLKNLFKEVCAMFKEPPMECMKEKNVFYR